MRARKDIYIFFFIIIYEPNIIQKIWSLLVFRVQKWAEDISKTLFEIERKVVRREELLKGFSDVKMEVRDGSAIVDRTAKRLEEVLLRRVRAAEAIMRKAEEIATPKVKPSASYTFDNSIVSYSATTLIKEEPSFHFVTSYFCFIDRYRYI